MPSLTRNRRSQNRTKITIRPLTTEQNSQSSVTDLPTQVVTPRKKARRKKSSPNLLTTPFLYILRLLILGVGVSAIAGTVLTVFDPVALASNLAKKLNLSELVPNFQLFSELESESTPAESENVSAVPEKAPQYQADKFVLKQELAPLAEKIKALDAKYPQIEPGAFFIDLDYGSYVSVRGEQVFAAASTIKIPILVAFFQDVDAGKIHLDEQIAATEDVVTSGSGDIQYLGIGKKYSALEVATKMIIISDNSATEMLIKRMGGKDALNKRFQEWGLKNTVINNILPDLEGTNITSPRDLVYVLARVNQGELISLRSRDRLFEIMRRTKTRTLLPQGLEKDALIAHKTGDIGSILGDAGIIDMPEGKRYIGAVFAKRPHNDSQARTLIQEISRTVYQHFKWYRPRPLISSGISGENEG